MNVVNYWTLFHVEDMKKYNREIYNITMLKHVNCVFDVWFTYFLKEAKTNMIHLKKCYNWTFFFPSNLQNYYSSRLILICWCMLWFGDTLSGRNLTDTFRTIQSEWSALCDSVSDWVCLPFSIFVDLWIVVYISFVLFFSFANYFFCS